MKILVSVKRVPDPESKIKLKSDASGIVTEGLTWVINPFCEIAVEEALRLKKAHGGEVVIVAIGDDDSTQQIRTALAMGADRGILVKVDAETMAQLDSEGVSRILEKVVEKESPDLMLMGKQAIDNDSGQAAQLLANRLGWAQGSFASKIESLESSDEKAKKVAIVCDDKTAKVTREIDGGLEVVEIDLPAVITTDLRLNVPRYTSLPGIMKAKRKKLAKMTVADLGVELNPFVKIVGLETPPEREAGIMVEDVPTLVDKLVNEAKAL